MCSQVHHGEQEKRWRAELDMVVSSLWYGWGGLNVWLFMLAQKVRSEAFDPALGLVSAIASFSSAGYYALAIGAVAVHAARDRERSINMRDRLSDPWGQAFFRFVLGTAMAAALVWLLKSWLHFPRPWELYGPRFGTAALLVDNAASFPSGHAAFAAALVGSLWSTLAARRLRAALLLFLVCVGLSRVLVGAHFPADVIGGYAVGFGCVWIAERLVRDLSGRRGGSHGHEAATRK